jgi:hypothetical protein
LDSSSFTTRPVVDQDLAAGDVLQAGQHAQQGGLAAARGPDQHHELAVGDVEAQALDDLGLAEGFLDVAEGYGCHGSFVPLLFFSSSRRRR